MSSLPRFELERLAVCLGRGLRRELALTPKPGLVDLVDNGSHPDLSVSLMLASCARVEGFFLELAEKISSGAGLDEQQTLGLQAEQSLLSEFATNTHKGAIFLGGLILNGAARGSDLSPAMISKGIAASAQTFFKRHSPVATNGASVRGTYRCSGIVGEACNGLPTLFEAAIPAFLTAIANGLDLRQATYTMLAILMQEVEDSTTLHRGGVAGLQRVRQDGAILQNLLTDGKRWEKFLQDTNRDYCRLNLTMGGIADLLGMAFGYLEFMGCWPSVEAQTSTMIETGTPVFTNL